MFNYKGIQNLNELETDLYNQIVKLQDRIINMTIRELASETHVSTATILRLCKKLGCDGFSEFKVKFKLNREEEKVNNLSNDTSELIKFLQCIENSKLDEKIEKLSEIIRGAENVMFIGSGTSALLSQYAARYFSSIGKFAIYMDDYYLPIKSKQYQNSVVIALSVSGETRIVIDLINNLKREGCTIASITNKEDCPIARLSDINLSYYIKEAKVKNNNVTSQLPVLYMIERIGKKVMEDDLSKD